MAFTEDITVVIVTKYLDEINYIFDKTLWNNCQCMISVGLKLAGSESEAILVSSGDNYVTSWRLRIHIPTFHSIFRSDDGHSTEL